ncbi:hypothetical protein QMN58_25690, partial [Escherichia coli]|nr:hypothetical protein [Escherichia coli]
MSVAHAVGVCVTSFLTLRFFYSVCIKDMMSILNIVDFSQPAKESVEYIPKAEAVLAGNPAQAVHT